MKHRSVASKVKAEAAKKNLPPRPPRAERKPLPPKPVNPLKQEARKVLARKRFGQNFLISASIIDGIVRCLDLSPQDALLEIGPGLGFLTQALLPNVNHMTAVELDRHMVGYLEKKFAPALEAKQLELIQQDILAYDLNRLQSDSFKVVGNLPYNITSGVLFKFAGELYESDAPWRSKIRQLTFMVQKEVGERICSTPGSKLWGPLSISLQYWFDCQLEFLVPSDCFEPAPKVTSVVISLFPKAEPSAVAKDLRLLSLLVRAAFQQRRKTLRNSLLHGTGLTEELLLPALESVGILPSERPEQLSIPQFVALTNAVAEAGFSPSSKPAPTLSDVAVPLQEAPSPDDALDS